MELFRFLYHLFEQAKLALFALVALSAVLFVLAKMLVRAWAVRRWPKADGVITHSEVDVTQSFPEGTDGPEISKYPIVEYAFEVRGRKYQSRKYQQIPAVLELEAEEMVSRYPKGASVAVYYNPSDPSDCVLNRDLPTVTVRAIQKTAVAAVLMALFCILAYRMA
jgi:hypothetical protein